MSHVERLLTLLKSLLVNLPIIISWGYRFDKIPTLLVEKSQIRVLLELLNYISDIDAINYKSGLSIESILARRHGKLVFFTYYSEKNKNALIEELYPLIQGDICSIPVIVSEEEFCDDPSNRLFIISISESIKKLEVPLEMVLPKETEIGIIERVIHRYLQENVSDNTSILMVAASFLYPIHIDMNQLEADYNLISDLVTQDEEMHDITGIEQQFIYFFRKYIENIDNTDRICELPCVTNYYESCSCSIFFYNDEYVYMSDELLKDIVKPMISFVPINAIKRSLKEKGIITSDNSSIQTYTVKMYYYKENSQHKSLRMLRFVRSKLTPLGDMDFIEAMI